MTEQMAIEYMENEVKCIEKASSCDRDCLKCGLVKEERPLLESFATAIQALEEIQQIKEAIKDFPLDCGSTVSDVKEIYRQLRECLKIGSVEELQALKEKNTPYKAKEYEDKYYACKCGNILLHKWRKYPTELMPKSEGLPYCMACGQHLDWE